MRFHALRVLSFCALLAVPSVALAQASKPGDAKPAPKAGGDMVESPIYKNWAQFKPGSFVKMKAMTDSSGMKIESTTTQTLKEVTPDKVVVEIEVTSMMNGQESKSPATKVEYPAKVAKGDAEKMNTPEGKTAEGKETIEVAGKKHDAKWVETTTKSGESTTKAKSWTSDDVPGMVLKMVVEMSGQTKMKMESMATEIKADKK